MHLHLNKVLLLALLPAALAAPPALGSHAGAAAAARIQSLTVSPSRLHRGGSTIVTWELSRRATTVFEVRRCVNPQCAAGTLVSKEIRRQGSTGLNRFRLIARGLRPARYKVVGTTRANSRRAFFRIVQ
jgi:hypothetical protein